MSVVQVWAKRVFGYHAMDLCSGRLRSYLLVHLLHVACVLDYNFYSPAGQYYIYIYTHVGSRLFNRHASLCEKLIRYQHRNVYYIYKM